MNPRFMLDTDIVSYFMRDEGGVAERLLRLPATDLCVSAITVAELAFGASRRAASKIHRKIGIFTRMIMVMPFDEACAIEFGRVAAESMKRGVPIGQMDAMIAAHALTLDVTLVTNNVRHFSRVRGLRVENWL